MKNSKNIDRLFQEKFKDFETEPNEQTWPKIQASLQEEKKERKIVPIWFKYTSIAAAFLLGFFALNSVYKATKDPKNTLVLDHEIVAKSSKKTDPTTIKTSKEVEKVNSKKQQQITTIDDINSESNRKKSDSFTTKTKSKSKSTPTQFQNSITVYQKEHNRSLIKNKLVKEAESETTIVENSNQNLPITTTLDINNATVVTEKPDIKIAQSNPEIKEATTTAVENELEKLLKEKENKKVKLALVNSKIKWEIVPNIAPMYLNTNSNGSAIDPELSKNSKSSDTGFSYGVGINYAVSKKIALRSGINTFSVGYNTNDVPYTNGLIANSMANINYDSEKGLVIQNQATYNLLTTDEKSIQKTSMGSINQKMGYYEIPLEISYTVLDKKFGINIIGGISTLFLKQNEIGLKSSESNFKLGEANNLSSFHYSTNFGFGLKYKFVESFQLHFEPMIKYQINTYTNESGNFKPIFIGLYSGISYRF